MCSPTDDGDRFACPGVGVELAGVALGGVAEGPVAPAERGVTGLLVLSDDGREPPVRRFPAPVRLIARNGLAPGAC